MGAAIERIDLRSAEDFRQASLGFGPFDLLENAIDIPPLAGKEAEEHAHRRDAAGDGFRCFFRPTQVMDVGPIIVDIGIGERALARFEMSGRGLPDRGVGEERVLGQAAFGGEMEQEFADDGLRATRTRRFLRLAGSEIWTRRAWSSRARLRFDFHAAPPLPLAEHHLIARAVAVAIEAEFVRVLQAVEAEELAAAGVETIEKGTVRDGLRHPMLRGKQQCRSAVVIGSGVIAPAILWSAPRRRLLRAVSGSSSRDRPC